MIALASLLKIAVDSKIGVGNPVGDFLLAIADGSATLPATSASLLPSRQSTGPDMMRMMRKMPCRVSQGPRRLQALSSEWGVRVDADMGV